MPKTIRKIFSDEMDIRLRILVQQYGTNNWSKISKEINIEPQLCKDRWVNHLSYLLYTGPWSKYEDENLLKFVGLYGIRWHIISRKLPGRTPIQTKNRYHQLLRNHFSDDFGTISDYDDDDYSPSFKISRRQMYCPSSFRPETVQKLLFANCKKRLEPGNNCVSTDCYSFDSTGHRVRCSEGQIKCAICEEIFSPSEIELDHISPVSRMLDQHATSWSKEKIADWYNDTDNLQATCQHCNRSKSDS